MTKKITFSRKLGDRSRSIYSDGAWVGSIKQVGTHLWRVRLIDGYIGYLPSLADARKVAFARGGVVTKDYAIDELRVKHFAGLRYADSIFVARSDGSFICELTDDEARALLTILKEIYDEA